MVAAWCCRGRRRRGDEGAGSRGEAGVQGALGRCGNGEVAREVSGTRMGRARGTLRCVRPSMASGKSLGRRHASICCKQREREVRNEGRRMGAREELGASVLARF